MQEQVRQEEADLLKELGEHLKAKLHKECLRAYIRQPGTEAIIGAVIEELQRSGGESH